MVFSFEVVVGWEKSVTEEGLDFKYEKTKKIFGKIEVSCCHTP